MTKYIISGVKGISDYTFALRIINHRVGESKDAEERNKKRKAELEVYDREKHILIFSTERKINPSELNIRLAEKGLVLAVLE